MERYLCLSKEQRKKEKIKLKAFCREYPFILMQLGDLEKELRPGTPNYNGMPKAHTNDSSVEKLAIKLANLQEKIDMIRLAAEEADFDMAEYIVEHVSNNHCSYDTLKKKYKIQTSKARFYGKVNIFYQNLYQLKCESADGSLLHKRIRRGKVRKDWAHEKR